MNEGIREAQHRLESKRAAQPKPFASAGDVLGDARDSAPANSDPVEPVEAKLERLRHEAAERARKGLTSWLESIGVPTRFRGEPDPALVPEALRTWASGFPRSLTDANALLCGPVGAGKTYAAAYLLRACYRAGRVEEAGGARFEWRCPKALFADAVDLVAAMYRDEAALIAAARSVDLLVVDDWGSTYEHEWSLTGFDRLVTRRHGALLATVVTTNVEPGDFAARYPRAASRLREGEPGLVEVVSEDRRAKA